MYSVNKKDIYSKKYIKFVIQDNKIEKDKLIFITEESN